MKKLCFVKGSCKSTMVERMEANGCYCKLGLLHALLNCCVCNWCIIML